MSGANRHTLSNIRSPLSHTKTHAHDTYTHARAHSKNSAHMQAHVHAQRDAHAHRDASARTQTHA